MRFVSIGAPLAALCLLGCSDTGPSGKGGLTELKKEDVKVGKGKAAEIGDTLIMQYTGKLANGKVFDASSKHADQPPFSFSLGSGQVIKGWDQGLVGMKEGGERKLSIPSSLGYGEKAMGEDIPANSDLFFDVHLLKVVSKDDVNAVTYREVKPGSGRAAKQGDTVLVKYSGSLLDGTVFDKGDQPIEVKIGEGKVVSGFEEALKGMKLGEERVITIPPAFGYGQTKQPGIPSGSWLVFDITIKSIK